MEEYQNVGGVDIETRWKESYTRISLLSLCQIGRHDMSGANWGSQTRKIIIVFTCGDEVFLSGANPHKSLQFI